MENRNDRAQFYADRVERKDRKEALKTVDKCRSIIDKIEKKIDVNGGQSTFFLNGHLILCSSGHAVGYYYGRHITVSELRLGYAPWRKITIVKDGGKKFPFIQFEENIYSEAKIEKSSEVSEDEPYKVKERIQAFSEEIDQWIPFTLPSIE